MRRYLLLSCIISIIPFAYQATSGSTGCTGSVELDELSFDKVVKKFDATLVKFDVAFPYGDKHDAYTDFAKNSVHVDEFLVAEVGVKDYGEKDNVVLAEKYGATKDNFPVVKLFIKGRSEPLTFDESKEFTTETLRQFVQENTAVYLSLPGCVRELDTLVIQFMKADKDGRKKLLKKTEEVQKTLGKKSSTGKIYKTIMERILEKGDGFLKTELERVKKLLSGKVSEEKKKELGVRVNILQTFREFDKQPKAGKEDL